MQTRDKASVIRTLRGHLHRRAQQRHVAPSGEVEQHAADHQPGADVLGQHHHGFFVEQALIAGLLQIGREFAVQACGALVIGGEQFGLDAEQIATVGRRGDMAHGC